MMARHPDVPNLMGELMLLKTLFLEKRGGRKRGSAVVQYTAQSTIVFPERTNRRPKTEAESQRGRIEAESMTDKIVVLVTGGNARECARIARHLLERRFIACANLVPQIRSLYRWEGKIADERECLMVLKSSRGMFPELRAEIEKLHSYSVPEIIALPIIEGSPDYLHWIAENLEQGADQAARKTKHSIPSKR
jgi:periplasmic divalent cation tolerance protein